MAEPSDISDAAGSVKTEPGGLAIPPVRVECGEVAHEHTHALVHTSIPSLPTVLVVVPGVGDLVNCPDDSIVKRGRGLEWSPVPRLVDADRLRDGESLVAEGVLAVLLALPDLHLVVVDVVAEDVLRLDDRLVVDGVAHVAQVEPQLDELLPIFVDELPLVAVLVEVDLGLLSGHDDHATRLDLALQVEPSRVGVPTLDGHLEVRVEPAVFGTHEPERDGRSLDHLVERDLATDLTGVTVHANALPADVRLAALALAAVDVLEPRVPE